MRPNTGEAYTYLLLVVLVLFLAPRLGTAVATLIDTQQVADFNTIHHLVQLCIPLTIMLAWPGKPLPTWGLRKGMSRMGWKWVAGFSIFWVSLYGLITVVYIYLDIYPSAYYDVTDPLSLSKELLFRGVVVGPSEEILFRAFPITILLMIWPVKHHLFLSIRISSAGIATAMMFTLAHIGITFFPLALTHLDPVQLFTALGFGLLYAIVFERTGSILYPVIIHSISDVVPVLSMWVIYL